MSLQQNVLATVDRGSIMNRINGWFMMIYGSLQAEFVDTKHNGHIHTYWSPSFYNIVVYLCKPLYNGNQILWRRTRMKPVCRVAIIWDWRIHSHSTRQVPEYMVVGCQHHSTSSSVVRVLNIRSLGCCYLPKAISATKVGSLSRKLVPMTNTMQPWTFRLCVI